MTNESVVVELREIIKYMPHSSFDLACKLSHSPIAYDAVPGKGSNVSCHRCRLEPLIARLEAPPNHDAEENLADYLLRTSPPDWNYEQILRLAKSIAIGDYLLRTSLTDWNYKKILRLAKQVGKERL